MMFLNNLQSSSFIKLCKYSFLFSIIIFPTSAKVINRQAYMVCQANETAYWNGSSAHCCNKTTTPVIGDDKRYACCEKWQKAYLVNETVECCSNDPNADDGICCLNSNEVAYSSTDCVPDAYADEVGIPSFVNVRCSQKAKKDSCCDGTVYEVTPTREDKRGPFYCCPSGGTIYDDLRIGLNCAPPGYKVACTYEEKNTSGEFVCRERIGCKGEVVLIQTTENSKTYTCRSS